MTETPNAHEPPFDETTQWSGAAPDERDPARLGDILSGRVQRDPAEPPFWQLEKDPLLIQKEKTDKELEGPLNALRRARELAHDNPDNRGFQTLELEMEKSVSEYARQKFSYGVESPIDLPPQTPRP